MAVPFMAVAQEAGGLLEGTLGLIRGGQELRGERLGTQAGLGQALIMRDIEMRRSAAAVEQMRIAKEAEKETKKEAEKRKGMIYIAVIIVVAVIVIFGIFIKLK